MQIILTEEEYNKLCARANDILRISEGVSDYQRRFRLALGNELLRGRHACGLSLEDVKQAIDHAEKSAKEIR